MRALEAVRDALRSPILITAILATALAALQLAISVQLLNREAEWQAKAAVDNDMRQIVEVDRIAPVVGALSNLRAAVEAAPYSVFYLVTEPDGQRLNGNLSAWPAAGPDASGWYRLDHAKTGGPRAIGRSTQLDGYYRLIVARSVDELGPTMRQSLALFAGLALPSVLLAIGASIGAVMRFRRRAGRMSAALRAYDRRELHVRVPADAGRDGLGALAADINLAMDQVEGLVTGYRTLADRVAHELKRPLALARLAADRPDAAPDVLHEVRAYLDQALETFEAVLTLSDLRAGLEQSRTQLDLDALAREAADLYAPVAEIKSVQIACNLAPAAVRGSDAELRRLLANLVDNAVKYTPSGGAVVLSTETVSDAVVFRIADGGPGLSGFPHDAGKPFERGPAGLETEGLGLGLSIVQVIAARHGATVHIGDQAGGGAVVEVAFPLLSAGRPRSPSDKTRQVK